ncbi:tRNA sulfurtransferase [Halapricum hydrolyticum]|uniref:Probable tRNA sulfurtransferase n=1 Tax=Halapricum hydrolyticum TaxID=2979991 RepID=A0AAE3IDK7_9EURY|nr:tRNA sulfurtransferase [Halapricum hydrolyticum]MCU4719171.1 tRNA sulfurtransferase [Halapricum hydrolyticum]MCU4728262.1 tRNA sulfurtransferase [Halapricum hydrolyticum]
MHPPDAGTVLVRHGELGVKSDQVRIKMERQLQDHIDALLDDRSIPGTVRTERNRLYVETGPGYVEDATDAATDAFGVVSASPARRVEPELDAILEAMRRATERCYDGGAFAVRARRAGPASAHAFSSTDLEQEGGAAVSETIESLGEESVVDLDDPEFTVFVECRPEKAFVFLEKREGSGGLPLGSQRPLVALLSGGHDSPVAAWEGMRRGSPVVPLYVDLGEFGGADHRTRAVATAERLAELAPQYDMRLRVAPAGELVADLVATVGETRMLSLRRAMLAMAEAVADDHDAVGIVTGESIGQKSSQTTANLAVTDAATDLPVHRPLVTDDKTDILERARALGTYEDTSIPAGCDRVAPEYPETNATLEAVEDAEPGDLFERARSIADDRTIAE